LIVDLECSSFDAFLSMNLDSVWWLLKSEKYKTALSIRYPSTVGASLFKKAAKEDGRKKKSLRKSILKLWNDSGLSEKKKQGHASQGEDACPAYVSRRALLCLENLWCPIFPASMQMPMALNRPAAAIAVQCTFA